MSAALPVSFRHEIETPQPMRAGGGYFQLQGWCLGSGPTPPLVRLNAAGSFFPVTTTVRRDDVISALGAESSASDCGFVIKGKLPVGAALATLEATDRGGEWQAVRQLVIIATPGELQASIEWPEGPTVNQSVRVQGWCAHPDVPIAEVWLHYGNRRIRCDYGLARTDVPGLLPGAPSAARAGFISVKNLPTGHGPLRVRAVTTSGDVYFARPGITVDIATDEESPEPLELQGSFPDLGPMRRPVSPVTAEPSAGGKTQRVLFVLYGDFTSNSALHVISLANGLIARGLECVVAVPHHLETIRYHPAAKFRTVLFDECRENPAVFRDARTADIVHAWTTRENVREFCADIGAGNASRLCIHLEDHELRILEASTGRSLESLLALPDAELDPLVPNVLSHPRRSRTFLAAADAVTVIIDRLRDLVPPGKPVHVLWPAADDTIFFPRPIPWDMRRILGWGEDHTVLFYHGNVHATNQAEVRELYAAVFQLNEAGLPTTLIRTGRDDGDFLGELGPRVFPHVIALGQVDHHHHLPPLMALADFFIQPGAPDEFNNYRFPSKLPEFFALGRPVILPRTNLGEILRHGEEAWILPQANAPAMAEAVRLLRGDAALRSRLSAGAAAVCAKYFNWDRSAGALLDFYNALPSRA